MKKKFSDSLRAFIVVFFTIEDNQQCLMMIVDDDDIFQLVISWVVKFQSD